MKKLMLVVLLVLVAISAGAGEIILGKNGKTNYQIVIPDKSKDAIVDRWLLITAKLMETAFEKNGIKIEVVKESKKAKGKPGIYLGATNFAKKNGVKVDQYNDWTYHIKAAGDNLIIVGNDKKDPIKTIREDENAVGSAWDSQGGLRFPAAARRCPFSLSEHEPKCLCYPWRRPGGIQQGWLAESRYQEHRFYPGEENQRAQRHRHKKTPMMRASYSGSNYETFYNIANNFFPLTSFVQAPMVYWPKAIPEKYAKTNPEYFALGKDGRRACDLKIPNYCHMAFCVTNQGVQDLMFKALEKQIKAGSKAVEIFPQDRYLLCRCNCEECNKLFGMKGETRKQYYARGSSGKLWNAYFKITERIRKKYPDVRVVILNYQDTPISADIIKKFPENVIPRIQFASQADFDKLKGVEFPAGVCGFEETFTGFGQAGPYLPERTPEHMAKVVQTIKRNNVKWSKRDGHIGYVRGMQAPAYYVYGRMMDDPSAHWKDIQNEFCDAAFGRVAPQMKAFFRLLHSQINIYSDFFGVMMPAWSYKYSRTKFRDSKWHVMNMYTPEYCALAEKLLASAEKHAKDPDVKARLHLVRIEFDYIRKMARIFYLQNAYTMHPSKANLDPLVDAIDEWHEDLSELAENKKSRRRFKPLSDWPEMRPFNGHFYSHAVLDDNKYQQQWKDTCLNWDTKAIRGGILNPERELKVPEVKTAPGIDSKAWGKAPEQVLKERGDMPFANVKTTMKVLRDKDALYILVSNRYPRRHPETIFKKKPDANIFKDEYVELGIKPPNSRKIYRIAVNPIAGSRYDSVFKPGKRNRMTEDKSWNGNWKFIYNINIKKVNRWNKINKIWTAWFRIPFSDFGVKVPAAGEKWGFNVGRNRIGQYMIWKDGRNVTTVKALGQLVF